MNELPDEILILLFGFLEPSNWITLSLVSKNFARLSEDDALWGTIIPTEWKDALQQLLEDSQQPPTHDPKPSRQQTRSFLQPLQQHNRSSWKTIYFNWMKASIAWQLAQKKKDEVDIGLPLLKSQRQSNEKEEKEALPNWISEKPSWHNNSKTQRNSWNSYGRSVVGPSSEYDSVLAILVAGPCFVGKTALLDKLARPHKVIEKNYGQTIDLDFALHYVTLFSANKKIKIQFWDCGGQFHFDPIMNSYLRGAHGVLLCFDSSNSETFQELKEFWLPKLVERGPDLLQIKIVGLQGDKPKQVRNEDVEEILKLDARIVSTWNIVSALEDDNVDSALMDLIANIEQEFTKEEWLIHCCPQWIPGKQAWQTLIQKLSK